MHDEELNEFGLRLSRFVVGTEGNVSRRGGGGFIIKSSGRSLNDNSFVKCNFDGAVLPNQSERPSIEVGFHSVIYRNSDYRFIAHTHPINTLKILCTNSIHDFATKRLFPDQVVFNGVSACVIPYATPGSKLTEGVKYATKFYHKEDFPQLLLLQNHGIVCCANSINEAVVMTEICEKAAEIFLSSSNLRFLSSGEISEIKNSRDEIYRRQSV